MGDIYPTHRDNPLLYAGFWKRVVAYIIDGIVRFVPVFVVMMVATYIDDPSSFMDPAADAEMGTAGLIGVLFMLLTYLLYYPLFEASRFQATPGKLLLGIIVTDTAGQRLSLARAFGRHFAGAITWMTSFLLYFGYWMAGVTERKQALHDLIASCLVINRNAEVKLPDNVRYVSAGFPVWAGVLVGLLLLVPVAGILAAIAIPAYMDYLTRATVAGAFNETYLHRGLVADHVQRTGKLPTSHEAFGEAWPQSVNDGQARVELAGGNLLITFTNRAPARIESEMIGMSLYREAGELLEWRCGDRSGQGQMLSRHDAIDLTTLDSRYLPAQCR